MRRVFRTIVRPFVRLFDRVAFIIFGQRAPSDGEQNRVPGVGGHGTGNRVPPHVPYNPDWDPDRKIP